MAELEEKLKNLGKNVVMYVYPGADHAFFNDSRPEVYDASASQLAFSRTVAHSAAIFADAKRRVHQARPVP